MPPFEPLEIRFWRKVDKRGPDECWLWTASCRSDGYGAIGTAPYKVGAAHRVSYELANGPVPPGEGHHGNVVMHTCDNRKCVNPAHLKLGTQKDNLTDMARKDRSTFGERHSGHKLTAENVKEIRADDDSSAEQLAARFGVHPMHINYLQRGKGWVRVGRDD